MKNTILLVCVLIPIFRMQPAAEVGSWTDISDPKSFVLNSPNDATLKLAKEKVDQEAKGYTFSKIVSVQT